MTKCKTHIACNGLVCCSNKFLTHLLHKAQQEASSKQGILPAEAELRCIVLPMNMCGCCTITQKVPAAAMSQLPTASGICLYASFTGPRACQQNTGINQIQAANKYKQHKQQAGHQLNCVGCRYLLPPIIFYAGISVKKKQFFRNFASIATFGVLGTYIAFAVIACVLYGFSKLPNVLNFSVSFSQITVDTAHHSLAYAESQHLHPSNPSYSRSSQPCALVQQLIFDMVG